MRLILSAILLLTAAGSQSESPRVTGIQAVSRNGQTFITWKDAAEGEAGAKFRYSLYRSDKPITQESLAQAELCYPGVLNNSAKQFGYAFAMKDRLDPAKPTVVLEEGGAPLPLWSGLAVRTVKADGKSHYAVVVTDATYKPLGKIEPGESATREPVQEKVAPIQPIKLGDSKTRGKYASSCTISGRKNLPLTLSLHGSQAGGGDAGDHGDLYLYFGTPEMGWRDGMPGLFSVLENSGALKFSARDCIETPSGDRPLETCWFGYFCVPFGAKHPEPRAYPFTERRLEFMVNWVIQKYHVDPDRVYSSGQSMGAMGSTQWAFRNPQTFAAIYARLGRVRQSWLPALIPGTSSINRGRYDKPTPMDDGTMSYFDRQDSVRWVSEHPEDLPFYGWCYGRQDWVEAWKFQIEMVKALTANKHGFALSWNNGGHDSVGAGAMEKLTKYYGGKFARNQSYPAFGNSSIDDNMGNGDKDNGDLVGGINLGFIWKVTADEPNRWEAQLSNDLAKSEMTVDVTPRRVQKFKAKAGEKFKWTNTGGGSGEVAADAHGRVTVEKVRIKLGEATTLTISR